MSNRPVYIICHGYHTERMTVHDLCGVISVKECGAPDMENIADFICDIQHNFGGDYKATADWFANATMFRCKSVKLNDDAEWVLEDPVEV